PFIPDGEAFLFPDAPGLMIDAIAPGNYNETVNTLGQEYYAKAEAMKLGKGYDLEAQSNPLPLNLIPKSSIRLTAT
ncbi:MAG: major capsid protein, partial [Fibrobacterota bacterium]